jgi:hypothetical protein
MIIPNGMTPIIIPQSLNMANSFPLTFSRIFVTNYEAVIDIGTFQVVAYPGADLVNDVTARDVIVV